MGRRQDRDDSRVTRIYRYILANDCGMAPCPENGLITLGTCKPVIRRLARPGDWVLGFRPGSLVRGLVLWAGKVECKMSHGEYQRTHASRSDAVYRSPANGE
jgi:Nucleotide modification associated domain 2